MSHPGDVSFVQQRQPQPPTTNAARLFLQQMNSLENVVFPAHQRNSAHVLLTPLRTQLVWYTHSTGCPFSPFVERVAANRGWTFLRWGLGGKKHQRSSKRLNPFHSWLTRTKSADAHDFPV